MKTDKNNTDIKLEGAKFKVTLPNGSSSEYTTNENGEITLPSISITGTGKDTITIEEVEAPAGYNKIINTLKLEITKGLQSGKYVVTNAGITEGQVDGVSVAVDLSKTVVTVTIPNEKITGGYSIKLLKTDGESEKLEGAKFKVTLPDGSSSEYTTSSNGEIIIPTINIAETGTDEIVIEEIEAPAGYNKIIETLKLQVTKGIESGKYVVTNAQITEGQVEGITAELNAEKTIITVTIPNEKITGGYTIKLVKTDKDSVNTKLEGAKFKVTFPDGSEQEYTTNSNGEITIPTIEITGTGTDTIKIEEIEAPKGYNKIIGTLTLQVTKGIDSGKYVITNAGITEGQVDGVSAVVDSSKTVITVTIPNVKKSGGYVLKLLKVDSNNPEQKLQGAVFNITLPGSEAKEYTTNENGEITLPAIEIAELGTDTITISEVKLPNGYYYISKDITLQVTKTDDGTKYVASDVKITDGEAQGVTVSIDKDTNIISLTIPNKKITGEYQLQLVKVDSTDSNKVLQGAKFKVTLADGTSNEYITNEQGIISIPSISISQEGIDTITIEELEAPEKYYSMIGILKVNVTKEAQEDRYVATKVEFTQDSQTNGSTVTVNDGVITVKVPNRPKQFDLKLIKRIVEVNGEMVPERLESVDITGLANGTSTTADYKMNKTPVVVKQGDIVKYTLRVYNEGEIDGYASEISEDIPEGLEFLWSEKDGAELDNDTSLSDEEKEAIKYNQGIWTIKEFDAETNRVEMISTDYLAKGKGEELVTDGANLIKAFDSEKGYVDTETEKNPDYKEVSVYMKVIAENQTGLVIRNEAAITGDTDSEGNPVDDRDSKPEDWVKYEDDEDYDNVELKVFDLALRKFIIAVSPDVTIGDDEYLKNEDGTYLRAPVVDASLLNIFDDEGNVITTATYNHTKEPLEVNKNDYIIYMLRVYNEGEIPGYATEITDYLPAGLEFVEGDFNTQYGWEVSEDGRKVTTRYLENQLINDVEVVDSKNVLSYKEVPIMCKLSDTVEYNQNQTNIAEISEAKDENKNDINDRDSEEDNVNIPEDEELPGYKDDEIGEYIPGQQDDDDFEKVYVKTFDLALRKFITGLNDEEITNRVPQPTYDEETGEITYNHTKEPIEVVNDDIVIYTIRVYNEGENDGYAERVSDDIPEYLEFLPDNEINQTYRWKMYDAEGNETEDPSNAVKIVTDYLSKAHGEEMLDGQSGTGTNEPLDDENAENQENQENQDGNQITDTGVPNITDINDSNESGEIDGTDEFDGEDIVNPNLIKAFDEEAGITETNPDYRDVKVAFKVSVPDRYTDIITNYAQVEEDADENGNPVDDIDSKPGEWNDGEDDQDIENIKPGYFDLSLRKWVTEAIVIEDGKQTVTQTGHTPDQDPEPVVKVEIHRNKLGKVTVKFRYSIRVTNEGTIPGYAKEITDYVPQGLRFIPEDNPGWTDEGNNVISTRLLENTLLQPGEHADVEVVLTWINGEDTMGLMTNIAEISEDDNEKGVPDIDSTPDNQVDGEDDIDDAPVILSISTGQARIYYVLGFTVLMTIAGGIVLIKKFVL